MTVIDLTGAVAAALATDPHYKQCPLPDDDCVFCREIRARVEAAVIAAAPVITSAVWATRPDGEDGLVVTQQWAARLPDGRVRIRATEAQARALAHAWSGELLAHDLYSGVGAFRVVADYSTPKGTTV